MARKLTCFYSISLKHLTAFHTSALRKLDHYGIRGITKHWIETWLTGRSQTVVVNGACSSAVQVKSGVPQGTVLGPLMFLIYINDIGDHIDAKLRLFADDSILYE